MHPAPLPNPQPPNFESLPYPRGGGRFDFFFFFFFFAKMRGKGEPKGTWSNFTPWLHILEHRGETIWGGGVDVTAKDDLNCTRFFARIFLMWSENLFQSSEADISNAWSP